MLWKMDTKLKTKRKNRTGKEAEWKQELNLTKKEAKKCRFKIVDQNWRLVECKVHKNHGFRIHPLHNYYLDNKGQLYVKIDNKLKVWYSVVYAKNKKSRGA